MDTQNNEQVEVQKTNKTTLEKMNLTEYQKQMIGKKVVNNFDELKTFIDFTEINEESKEEFAKILFKFKKGSKMSLYLCVNGLDMVMDNFGRKYQNYSYLMTLGCYAYWNVKDRFEPFMEPRGSFFFKINNHEDRLWTAGFLMRKYFKYMEYQETGYWKLFSNDFNPFEEFDKEKVA